MRYSCLAYNCNQKYGFSKPKDLREKGDVFLAVDYMISRIYFRHYSIVWFRKITATCKFVKAYSKYIKTV